MSKRRIPGGCICGALKFEVELDPAQGFTRCNCSICTKIGITTAIVKPDALVSTSGEDTAGTRASGPNVRFFCAKCGVHCFARGELEQLGGAFVSINANTLEGVEPREFSIQYFDGRHNNWMAGTRPEPWPTL